VPVLDVEAAAMPLVGPREHEHARAAGGKGASDLPVERASLGLLAVAAAVEPRLGDDQRPVAGDVLEAGGVGLELGAGLEEDVETDEIHEVELKVLGAWIVHVGDER